MKDCHEGYEIELMREIDENGKIRLTPIAQLA